jgi:hypothetical protein
LWGGCEDEKIDDGDVAMKMMLALALALALAVLSQRVYVLD